MYNNNGTIQVEGAPDTLSNKLIRLHQSKAWIWKFKFNRKIIQIRSKEIKAENVSEKLSVHLSKHWHAMLLI